VTPLWVCLTAGALHAHIATERFTLAWTHSIERIRWEEDYRVRDDAGLELVEARIRGSGAGMEPPPGAVLRDGVWHYRPALRDVPALRLTRSGFSADYELCIDGNCRSLAEWIPVDAGVTTVTPCSTR
jgi:hypothetical protein